MVNPPADHSGRQRDGFDAWRGGQVAGRTGGRTFVWQRTGRRQETTEEEHSGEHGEEYHKMQEEMRRGDEVEGGIRREQQSTPQMEAGSTSNLEKAAEKDSFRDKMDVDQSQER
jgi:hypothetical protein